MKSENTFSQCILVCVTDQKECERLIDVGRSLADQDGAQLHIINIQPESRQTPASLEALSQLYEKAKTANAEMTVYFNDEPILTAAAHIKKYNATRIVAGLPGNNSSGFLAVLRMIVPDIEMDMVDKDSRVFRMPAVEPSKV